MFSWLLRCTARRRGCWTQEETTTGLTRSLSTIMTATIITITMRKRAKRKRWGLETCRTSVPWANPLFWENFASPSQDHKHHKHHHHHHKHSSSSSDEHKKPHSPKHHHHEKSEKNKGETRSETSSPASAPITPRARPSKDMSLAHDIEQHAPNTPPSQPMKKVYSVCLPPGIDNIKNLSPGTGTHKFSAL